MHDLINMAPGLPVRECCYWMNLSKTMKPTTGQDTSLRAVAGLAKY